MFKKINKNIKGFTLMELIIVMAVIGILVMLAVPKFKEFRDRAYLTQIKNDSRVVKDLSTAEKGLNQKLPSNDKLTDTKELSEAAEEGKLYFNGNPVDSFEYQGGEYYKLNESFLKDKVGTHLTGDFVLDDKLNVYYIDDKNITNNKKDDISISKTLTRKENVKRIVDETNIMEHLNSNTSIYFEETDGIKLKSEHLLKTKSLVWQGDFTINSKNIDVLKFDFNGDVMFNNENLNIPHYVDKKDIVVKAYINNELLNNKYFDISGSNIELSEKEVKGNYDITGEIPLKKYEDLEHIDLTIIIDLGVMFGNKESGPQSSNNKIQYYSSFDIKMDESNFKSNGFNINITGGEYDLKINKQVKSLKGSVNQLGSQNLKLNHDSESSRNIVVLNREGKDITDRFESEDGTPTPKGIAITYNKNSFYQKPTDTTTVSGNANKFYFHNDVENNSKFFIPYLDEEDKIGISRKEDMSKGLVFKETGEAIKSKDIKYLFSYDMLDSKLHYVEPRKTYTSDERLTEVYNLSFGTENSKRALNGLINTVYIVLDID